MMSEANGRGGCPDVAVPLLVGSGDVCPNDDAVIKHGLHAAAGSTSFFKTCFNGVNALSGVGILSIPYALASGGWLSLSLFFLVAGCTYYTALLIQRCMDMDSSIRSYPDIGERAFGAMGRTLVSVSMNVELYMVSTGFLIVEGDNLHGLFPDVEFEIFGVTVGGKHSFILIVGLFLLLPTIWPDNMNLLSYFSAGGVIASSILVCTIFWAAAVDGIGFHEKGTVLNLKGIPTAVSLYAFCYCAHPVFPTLYISMRDQRQFSKVMLVSFLFCTTGYASMAVMGYLMFGSNVESQITLNLPTDKISSKVAIYTTIINPLAKYTLMVTPIVHALESSSLLSYNPSKGYRVLIRACVVVSTMIVALTLPFFGYLMSLVGAFLSITASVIIPCLCYLKLSGLHRRFELKSIIIGGIVLVGLVILVVGTFVALQQIYQQLLK